MDTQNIVKMAQSKKAKMLGGVLLFLLLLVIILGYSAQKSLPGEALYSFKTDVVEPTVEITAVSQKSKALYQIDLLKKRLTEVQSLAKQESIDDQALTDLTTQIQKHNTKLTTYVGDAIDSAFPKTEVLSALTEFASVAGAIEVTTENDPLFKTFGDDIEDIRRNTVNLYKDKVVSFVQTETEQTVLAYIQSFLTEVKTALGKDGVSEATIDDADNYLDRVVDALTAKRYDRAITAIAEAYRFIKIEEYAGKMQTTTVNTNEIPTSTSTPRATSTLLESTSSVLFTQ